MEINRREASFQPMQALKEEAGTHCLHMHEESCWIPSTQDWYVYALTRW